MTGAHATVALFRLLSRRSAPAGRVDVVVALGSSDIRTADRTAALVRATAPGLVVCSGGRGRLTGHWPRPEAVELSDALVERGVDRQRILTESASSNTLENANYVAALLPASGRPRTIAIVTRPHLRLRSLLTFQRRFATENVLAEPADTPDQAHDIEVEETEMAFHVRNEVPRIEVYSNRGDIDPPEVPLPLLDAWRTVAAERP